MRLAFLLLILTLQIAGAAPVGRWEVWEDCRLEADKYFDADSFRIRHGSDAYVLRLYFVDAPETDKAYGERIQEQAAYFHTTEPAILRAGATAKEFTEQFLGKSFRVITRRQPAPGASRDPRFYAIVVRGGERLDAALVSAGLSRTTSEIATYPDAAAGQRDARALRLLEAKAASTQRGIWNGATVTLKEALQPRTRGVQPRLINLNTATATDLASLPGVGPKTAAQIIRARPLKDLTALDALPGFGPKKMEALRELVGF